MTFIRFLCSGGFNTAVTYALYLVALLFMPYWAAYTLSYVAGMGIAYTLNRFWVFRQHRGAASVVLLPLVYLAQFAMGLLIVWLWVDTLAFPAEFAPLVAIAITVPITFVLSRAVFSAQPTRMDSMLARFGQTLNSRTSLVAGIATILFTALSLWFPQSSIFIHIEAPKAAYELHAPSAEVLPIGSHAQIGRDFARGIHLPGKVAPRFALKIHEEVVLPANEIIQINRTLLTTKYVRHGNGAMAASTDLLMQDGRLFPIGPEPLLHIDLSASEPQQLSRHINGDALFLFALLWSSFTAAQGLIRVKNRRLIWLAGAFTAVVVVASIKALTLPLNHGPDEEMHLGSLYWYFANLRPPALSLGDQPFLHVIWQSSYVLGAAADLTYLMTARVGVLLGWILPMLADFQLLRLAQILLVLLGAGLCARYCGPRYAVGYLIAWILIPQSAYTATYVNGDVLSYAMGFIAAALILADPHRKELDSRRLIASVVGVFLLLNAKSNFLPLLGVLCCWLVFQCKVWRCITLRRAIWLLALSPILLYRRLFNYWDQSQFGASYLDFSYGRIMALLNKDPAAPHQEEFNEALAFFQNDAPFRYVQTVYERMLAGPSHYDFSILTNADWYLSSFHSLFGVFGYMNAPVSWWLLSLPIGLFAVALWQASHINEHRLLLGATAVLTVMASLYYSVSQGYQAQGRYLFPIVCLTMALMLRRQSAATDRFAAQAIPVSGVVTVAALLLFSP